MKFQKGHKRPGNRFKKGQSGNPKGKPKGARSFKTLILEYADKIIDYEKVKGKKTIKTEAGRAMVMTLLTRAIAGDMKATKLILEHCEGKKLVIDDVVNREPLEITDDMTPERAAEIYKQELKNL